MPTVAKQNIYKMNIGASVRNLGKEWKLEIGAEF